MDRSLLELEAHLKLLLLDILVFQGLQCLGSGVVTKILAFSLSQKVIVQAIFDRNHKLCRPILLSLLIEPGANLLFSFILMLRDVELIVDQRTREEFRATMLGLLQPNAG